MAPSLWVDHRPRIAFYVRAGLVPEVPTDAQLKRAFETIRTGVGLSGQLRYYARHPLMMLPTARKRAATRHGIAKGYLAPHQVTAADADADAGIPRQPRLDRLLETTFLFPPARLAVQTLYNPWAVVASSGLNVPRRFLIAHILQTNHPPPAIWDMQILQADAGGLDELRIEIERAMRSRKLRARIDRSLGNREGYYEHLLEWMPRLQRFEFPPVPPALRAVAENVVDYLRHATAL